MSKTQRNNDDHQRYGDKPGWPQRPIHPHDEGLDRWVVKFTFLQSQQSIHNDPFTHTMKGWTGGLKIHSQRSIHNNPFTHTMKGWTGGLENSHFYNHNNPSTTTHSPTRWRAGQVGCKIHIFTITTIYPQRSIHPHDEGLDTGQVESSFISFRISSLLNESVQKILICI